MQLFEANQSLEEKLMAAVKSNHVDTVRRLLDEDPKLIDRRVARNRWPFVGSNGAVALLKASIEGHLDMVCYLVKKRPTLFDHVVGSCLYYTPLIAASEKGHFDIVKHLLDWCLKLNKKNQLLDYRNAVGNTALMLASDIGNVKMVRLLLDYGANLNYFNRKAQTAFFMAAQKDKLAVARLLLSRGAIISKEFDVDKKFDVDHDFYNNRGNELEFVSDFLERNPSFGVIPKNRDQTVYNLEEISSTSMEISTVNDNFFKNNPALRSIPINLEQAVTETFHAVANTEILTSELVRACRLIAPYHVCIKAFVVNQGKDATAKEEAKAKVTINSLPLEIRLMIMEYVCKNLEEMASQHDISLRLLRDVYNHFEKNSAAIMAFYDALDHHDWCEPWVRPTASTTLTSGR